MKNGSSERNVCLNLTVRQSNLWKSFGDPRRFVTFQLVKRAGSNGRDFGDDDLFNNLTHLTIVPRVSRGINAIVTILRVLCDYYLYLEPRRKGAWAFSRNSRFARKCNVLIKHILLAQRAMLRSLFASSSHQASSITHRAHTFSPLELLPKSCSQIKLRLILGLLNIYCYIYCQLQPVLFLQRINL